jgi:pimeloyl-CoA synthetase
VGGPSSDDSYVDNRQDYVRNEVALDYNAGERLGAQEDKVKQSEFKFVQGMVTSMARLQLQHQSTLPRVTGALALASHTEVATHTSPLMHTQASRAP